MDRLGHKGTAADEQLAMDLGSAPQPVLKTHSSDEIAHLFADLRSAPERTGFPSPVGGKTRSMPTHNSLGPDDPNGVKYARTATIEPNEQSTVGPTQMRPDEALARVASENSIRRSGGGTRIRTCLRLMIAIGVASENPIRRSGSWMVHSW